MNRNRTVVYEAATDVAGSVMDAMRRQGLHPSKVEGSGPDEYGVSGLQEPHYRRGQWRDMVHIAVPSEEADHARSFLRRMDEQSRDNVQRLAGSLRGAFVLAFVATALIGCVLALLGTPVGILVPLLPVVWFAALIIAANLGKLAQRTRHTPVQSSQTDVGPRE